MRYVQLGIQPTCDGIEYVHLTDQPMILLTIIDCIQIVMSLCAIPQ